MIDGVLVLGAIVAIVIGRILGHPRRQHQPRAEKLLPSPNSSHDDALGSDVTKRQRQEAVLFGEMTVNGRCYRCGKLRFRSECRCPKPMWLSWPRAPRPRDLLG